MEGGVSGGHFCFRTNQISSRLHMTSYTVTLLGQNDGNETEMLGEHFCRVSPRCHLNAERVGRGGSAVVEGIRGSG